MTIDVLDQTGKKLDAITLNKAIFGAPVVPSLIAQAIRVRLINARTGTAHTKTRDEISGGGRKPWRQKGTGRARHGSTRSPIWRGGGITHGPRFHKPSVSMPTAMRRAALFAALTDKLQQKSIVVLDKLSVKEVKTKEIATIVAALPVDRTALVVVPAKDEKLQRAMSNLPQIKLMQASVLHPYEILKYRTVIFLQDSLPVLEKTFLDKTVAEKSDSGNDQPTDEINPKQAKPRSRSSRSIDEAKKPAQTKTTAKAKKAE